MPLLLLLSLPPNPTVASDQTIPANSPPSVEKSSAAAAAIKRYEVDLPSFVQRFQQCTDKTQLSDAYEDFVALVKAPWMTMAAPKPARFRPGWSRQLDAIAKERAKQPKIQFGTTVLPEESYGH